MLFDRYRKAKRQDATPKKSSLAETFLRKLPHALKAWQQPQQHRREQQCSPNIVMDIVPPRSSISLPNINQFDVSTVSLETSASKGELHCERPKPETTSNISLPEVILNRVPKRHSADLFSSREDISIKRAKSDVQRKRHTYSFGDLMDGVTRLTVTEPLPVPVVSEPYTPQRSRSQQLLPSQPKANIPRAHSISSPHVNKSADEVRYGKALSPSQLATMLDEKQNVILIDVRNLVDFQNRRIKGSLNVNLPSLLVKRFQRGTFSNFNLENFITTAEGRDRYARCMQQLQTTSSPRQQQQQQQQPSGSILEQKAAEAAAKMKRHSLNEPKTTPVWVVYDEDMLETHRTSPAWTLLSVLDRALANTVADRPATLYSLTGGFQAFETAYSEHLVEGAEGPAQKDAKNNDPVDPPYHENLGTRPSSLSLPRRSVSYTVGERSTHNRRISLFSLDTQAARANNADALARRANRRSQVNGSGATAEQGHHQPCTTSGQDTQSVLHQHLKEPSMSQTCSTTAQLDKVVETEDEAIFTEALSPQTEADFAFNISEIIPGFLFVGPEIETLDQVRQLELRRIQRVLNMAEECNDDVLPGKMIYRKIAARDTVEMGNVDSVMLEAVSFIESAKHNHEPTYVHCKAGKSRSVTAILAYLVASERWTLKKAYRHVIKARPNMSPNIGFIAELMKMEGQVHGRVSSFMETDWLSSSMPSPDFVRDLQQLKYAWQRPNEMTTVVSD